MSGNNLPSVPLKPAKAWLAAIGGTSTALLARCSAVGVYAEDDTIDLGQMAPTVGLTISLVGTVYGVWKITNHPKNNADSL